MTLLLRSDDDGHRSLMLELRKLVDKSALQKEVEEGLRKTNLNNKK